MCVSVGSDKERVLKCVQARFLLFWAATAYILDDVGSDGALLYFR